MNESPDEMAARWLRLEKEYAGLDKLAREIMKSAGIQNHYEAEMRILPSMHNMNDVLHAINPNPSPQLLAYHEISKIGREQFQIAERMKKLRIMAVARGFTLPDLTLMELSPVDSVLTADTDKKPTPPDSTTTPRRKTQTAKKPTVAERVIIDAINQGLTGQKFCIYLDANNVPPRASWRDENRTLFVWPGKYKSAYCHPDDEQKQFWMQRIPDYKNKIKRKFGL